MGKKYKIMAIPLTNIHIGSGEQLEPLDYYIYNCEFIRLNPKKIIGNLNETNRNIFIKIIDSNRLKDVAKFLYENLTEESVIYRTNVSESMQLEFNEKFTSTENQQLVFEMYRDKSDFKPVIPGSSIKGAIRTAVLYKLMIDDNLEGKINSQARIIYKLMLEVNRLRGKARREKFSELNKEINRVEKIILKNRDVRNDPFRTIKISDCRINGKDTDCVVKVKNYHLKTKRFREFLPSVEAIKGIFLKGDGKGVFEVNFFDELKKIKAIAGWEPLQRSFTIEYIFNACREFYRKNLLEDLKRFNYSGFLRLKEEFQKLSKNETIIRLGRFSQKENVTIISHTPKSRMIDEYNFPMGYLKLRLI